VSSQVSSAGLVQLTKDLGVAWDETKASWRDQKAREFEEKFLTDLPHHVGRAAQAIEEINALLGKVRADCG